MSPVVGHDRARWPHRGARSRHSNRRSRLRYQPGRRVRVRCRQRAAREVEAVGTAVSRGERRAGDVEEVQRVPDPRHRRGLTASSGLTWSAPCERLGLRGSPALAFLGRRADLPEQRQRAGLDAGELFDIGDVVAGGMHRVEPGGREQGRDRDGVTASSSGISPSSICSASSSSTVSESSSPSGGGSCPLHRAVSRPIASRSTSATPSAEACPRSSRPRRRPHGVDDSAAFPPT